MFVELKMSNNLPVRYANVEAIQEKVFQQKSIVFVTKIYALIAYIMDIAVK